MPRYRYRIVTAHGECRSLFYLVDTDAPEGEQPAVIATYHNGEQGRRTADMLNRHEWDERAAIRLAERHASR